MKKSIIVLLAALVCSGCAAGNMDNLHAFKYVNEHMVPGDESWNGLQQAASAPVVLPVAMAAMFTDLLVIHPAIVSRDAWYDTCDFVQGDYTTGQNFALNALLTAPRAIAAPAYMVGDWLARSVADLPPHPKSKAAAPTPASFDTEKQSNASLPRLIDTAAKQPAHLPQEI